MIHGERSIEIDAPPEAVWTELARYMHIDEFAPQITSVDALSDGEDGVGSKRRNHFDNGGSMVEEVTDWRPDRGYTVQSSEFGSMPLHEMTADISIEPVGDGRSKVTWGTNFRPKYGPVGWLMGQTVMKRMMGGVIDGNLEALAEKVQADQTANA